MKILFNLMNCGLGDNGGSSTIIKSANTLVDLGHDVIFIDSIKNKHTWTPLKAKHIIVRKTVDLPKADVVIATGYNTVSSTMSLPPKCGVRFHWIRAWEHWVMSDDMIVKNVLAPKTVKMVNSICLKDKLKKYGFESHIIRPGYDFDELYPEENQRGTYPLIVGGLYREGVHGQRKRTQWIFNAVESLKRTHNVSLCLFGSEKKPKNHLVDFYFRSPDKNEKRKIYNMCDIWLSPTMSEGLHLPPAEAMLTECPVVGTDAELSGMQDYLFDGVTGLIANDNMKQFIGRIGFLLKNSERRLEYGKNARKQILSLGDRKENMKKMIKLFERLI